MLPINKSEKGRLARDGFSLVEMLVSIAILTIISLVLFTMLDRVSSSYRYANSKVEEFSQARAAFEAITDRLSQATLNPYWDYDNLTTPKKYIRQSELRFISGNATSVIDQPAAHTEKHYTDAVFFQAPMGLVSNTGTYGTLKNLLNTGGYFVEYGSNSIFLPTFFGGGNSTTRFRLIEFTEPSENLSIYQYTSGLSGTTPLNLTYATKPSLPGLSLSSQYTASNGNGREWFLNSLYTSGASHVATDKIHVLADNVIALILLPKLSSTKYTTTPTTGTMLAPAYSYDSTATNPSAAPTGNITAGDLTMVNQLPPIVQVTMVAIDEVSAQRLSANPTSLATLQGVLSNLFQDATAYQTDLSGSASTSLEQTLIALKLNYRIFTTDVYIKEAKWSHN